MSLIYVGQELESNIAAVRAGALQSITNSSSTSMLASVENGEFAGIRLRGGRDPSQLSEVEQLRLVLYQRQMWLHFQNVWTQWRLGVIDNAVWAGYRRVLCNDLLGTPVKRDWWAAAYAYALSEEFLAVLERCERPGT